MARVDMSRRTDNEDVVEEEEEVRDVIEDRATL